jgi:phage shock protein A
MSFKAFLRRLFALFVPPDDTPESGPVEVFEEALRAARQRFLDLRATASPLYQSRDSLLEQEKARVKEVEDLAASAAQLASAGDQKEALVVASRHVRAHDELTRVRQELADIAKPIEQVEERLKRIEGEVRDLERERDRSAALLKSADARLAVDRIMAAYSEPADAAKVAAAREKVNAKLAHARAVEQVSAGGAEAGMAAIEAGLEEDRARKQLEAIMGKAQLPPGQDSEKDKGL